MKLLRLTIYDLQSGNSIWFNLMLSLRRDPGEKAGGELFLAEQGPMAARLEVTAAEGRKLATLRYTTSTETRAVCFMFIVSFLF